MHICNVNDWDTKQLKQEESQFGANGNSKPPNQFYYWDKFY